MGRLLDRAEGAARVFFIGMVALLLAAVELWLVACASSP